MNRVEVKNNLRRIINKYMLSNLDAENEVPTAVADQILENYCCTFGEKSSGEENLDVFLKNLQKWVEDNHKHGDDSTEEYPRFDFDGNIFEKYIQAETEYFEVTSEIAKVLKEVVKQKETYSQHFKNECRAQQTSMELLAKKCECLKLQIFLKLFSTENAIRNHLTLRVKLKEQLDLLKKEYSEWVEYNKQMSEIKDNKAFCELFRAYKELKKLKQRMEIISTV